MPQPSTLIDLDPITGTETHFHYDDLAGTMTFETSRDVSDITDLNQDVYKEFDERSRWGDFQNRAASIPDFLFHQLVQKFGPMKDNQAAWKKWLNDPDNKLFRTRPGRI